MEHKKWVILCIVGGVLMLLSSLVGRIGFLGTLITLLTGHVPPEVQQILDMAFTILTYIAAGGGLSVIIGALIAGYSSDFAGRLIAGIGIGTGLISLISLIATSIIGGATINHIPSILFTAFNSAYGFAGVVISIIARMRLKD